MLADVNGENVSVGAVVAILSAAAGLVGHRLGKSSRVHLEPQPLQVQLQEQFVSRREFEALRAEVRLDFTKLEGLISRAAETVEEKHLQLLETIERAAKTGVDGRVALWNELKPLGRDLAALKATSDVATQLAKLADVLKANKPNGR